MRLPALRLFVPLFVYPYFYFRPVFFVFVVLAWFLANNNKKIRITGAQQTDYFNVYHAAGAAAAAAANRGNKTRVV